MELHSHTHTPTSGSNANNHAVPGSLFLHQLHQPAMASDKYTFPPSTKSRPSRLQRRTSHPPSSSASRLRAAQEDGEFIKRAFENLSVNAGPSSSAGLWKDSHTSNATTEAEQYDDPIMLSTYWANSRSSIASTSSHPYSANSGGSTQLDHASVRSFYPLLEHDRRDSPNSPPTAASGRQRRTRHQSSTHSDIENRSYMDASPPDGTGYPPNAYAAERRGAQSGSGPTAPNRPAESIYTQNSAMWIDPFADSAHDLHQLRFRRSSTISGYSVNISDWNSLRRGSLASLENTSPTSATHGEHHSIPSQPRSRNTTSSGGNGSMTASTNYPTDASAYATLARSEQPMTSVRWEAWATAYRERLLHDMQSGQNAFYNPGGGPRYMDRYPAISEETSAAIPERNNLFYPLRRQFIARAGSRSEGNRILILELCHALEEYEIALGTLYRLAQTTSPHTAMVSLSTMTAPTATASISSPPRAVAAPTDSPPSPRYLKGQGPSSLDKNQLDRLADEVDSLIREVIEAVPAFSYSLSQGSYGPLPLRVNSPHTTAPDITIQQYFEQVHVLHSTYSDLDTSSTQPRPSASRPFSLSNPAVPISSSSGPEDIEQESLNMEQWWPNRLRTDLREGLLMDDAQDSPNISLQSISVLPSISYRQDASGMELPVGAQSSQLLRHNSSEADFGKDSAGQGRNVQLLAEGKRRWREYLQGRQ